MKFEKLKNIIEVKKGKKPSIVDVPDENSVRVLQIDDLRNDNNPKYTNDKSGVYAKEDDVLIAWDGANAGTIGYGKSGFIGSTIALLRKKHPQLYSTIFIGIFLKTQYQLLRSKTTGATIPHISRKALDDLRLPVISVDDQLHIANLLSKAENLIAQRKESIRLLDEYLKSTFLEMFYSNPDKFFWNEVKFEELAAKKKGSMRTGPFGSSLLHGEFTETGDVKVLGIDNVVTNQFDWKRSRCITNEKYQELKRYRVFPNDVLISIMATLGRTAVVPKNIPLCINSKHLAAITLDDKIANSYFIAFAFHSHPLFIRQMSNNTKGAIMDGLNLTIIRNIKLKLPPIELQNLFGKILKKTEALKINYLCSLQELENLYGSLSQKAFRGELSLKEAEEQILMAAEPKGRYGKIIEMEPRTCDSSERAILAGHIINQTNQESFGRVKFQKLLHLTEYICKIDIGSNFTKKVAGPHDGKLIEEIESTLQRYRYYDIKQSCKGNQKVNYTPLSSVNELEEIFKSSFESEAERIDVLLSKFKKSSWEQCEIVSTLYAVWNNRLIKKEVINDELLKQDFLNWDKQKIKYQDRLDGALQWMKDKEVIPIGWGKLIE